MKTAKRTPEQQLWQAVKAWADRNVGRPVPGCVLHQAYRLAEGIQAKGKDAGLPVSTTYALGFLWALIKQGVE